MKRLIMVMASLVGALTHADVRGADPETFSDWVKMLKGGDGGTSNWVVDKLDGFAEGYKSRIAANPNDYEARLLHAATLVASLGENETMRSYLTTFGFEIDYLGLKLSGEQSAPATWPDTNEIVDAAVAQCAPILQEALDDLKAIPDGWTGEVHLDSATWPLDEDVYIDIADVLYARAGLESVLGVLYFLKGYDLTVDWPKARNLDKPQIPVLAHAPDMVNDDGWDGVLTWGSRDYYDLSAGPAIQMAFADNRLYIRLNSDDGFEDDDFLYSIFIAGTVDAREIEVWYSGWDGSFTVNDGTVPYPERTDSMDWAEWQELYNQYSANDIVCPAEFSRSMDGIAICVDVSGALSDDDIREMVLSYAPNVVFERPSRPRYLDGWFSTYYGYDGDGKLSMVASFLKEQTNFFYLARSLDSLAVSKGWMRSALTDSLSAYVAMTNRIDDGKYRFVEYDPALSNEFDVARMTTEKALAALDVVMTIDSAETFGKYNPDKDYTLLPNNGVMQVYLGALFSGSLNRDLVPTFEVDKYGTLKPVGTIPDATLGGALPLMTSSQWIETLDNYDIEHGLNKDSTVIAWPGDGELPDGYSVYDDGNYVWVWRMDESYGIALTGFYNVMNPDPYSFEMYDYCGVYPAPVGEVSIPSFIPSGTFGCVWNGLDYEYEVITEDMPIVGLDENLFVGCSRMTQVVIPSSVTSIGSGAFYGCSGLTSVTIPNSVTSIGNGAFMYCYSLTNVTFLGDAPMIGETAFVNVNAYCTVYVRRGSIGWNVDIPGTWNGMRIEYLADEVAPVAWPGEGKLPEDCSAYDDGTYTWVWRQETGGGAVLTGYNNDFTDPVYGFQGYGYFCGVYPDPIGVVSIPSFIPAGTIGRIWTGSEYVYKALPEDIPVVGMDDGLFLDCSEMMRVVIPAGVTNVHAWAFDGCGGLIGVDVADGNPCYKSENGFLLTKEGERLVQGINGDVVVPNGVTVIGDSAFYGCFGLESVTIPDSVTLIEEDAFAECSSLTDITIPDSVTNIESYAFYACSNLTEVLLPQCVTSIGDGAFFGCWGLADEDGFVVVRNVLYGYDGNVSDVTIPDSVTSIGEGVFAGCYALTSIIIPNSVVSIGELAFDYCIGLTNVTIGSGVTSIGFDAFCYCTGLTSMTIPSSVTNVGEHAFYGCGGLTNLVFEGDAPSIGPSAFDGMGEDCVVLVRRGSTGWDVEIPGTWNGMRIEYSKMDEPDLTLLGVVAGNMFAMPGDTVTVRYVEMNIGTTNAVAPWYDRVMLEGEDGTRVNLKTWSVTNGLEIGQVVTNEVQCTIPYLVSLAGDVRFVVVPDVNDDVEEVSDANNEGKSEVVTLGKRLYLNAFNSIIDPSELKQIMENAASGERFKVWRSGPLDEAVAVVVSTGRQFTSPAAEVTVDGQDAHDGVEITIPAGSVSTIFTVAPVDNAVLDGGRLAWVSVSADGFNGPIYYPLVVLDDEVPRLTVTLNTTSIREGDGVITATVMREGSTEGDLTVYLSGTSGSRASYPSSVVIPSGAASATFEISVPNNDTAQVASELTLRASSSGYQSAAVTYTVEDDDVPGVVLTIAPEAVQEGGVVRATLMRADTSDQSKAITVRLTASNPEDIASMPSSVTIPARTAGRSFYIYIADDGLDNFDHEIREITIDGAVLIESCGCNGQPSSGDAITATLGIIDNDGPALSLRAEPATMKEGLDLAGYLILSHNSMLAEDLQVDIWADAAGADEVELPEYVIIPAGATSVRIPVKTLDDGVEDGSQLISIYAKVDGDAFAPASTWVLVTDQNMPDLYAVEVMPQYSTAVSGESLSVSFSITNAGYKEVSGDVAYAIYCVKGTNSSYENTGTMVCSGVVAGGIAIGGALSVSRIVTIPNVVGDCRFVVEVDPDDALTELDNANNTTYSSVVSISPSYIAEAQVEGSTFLQGTELEITGMATMADGTTPAANVEVEIYVVKAELRLPLSATTDAQGRFAVTFKPTSAEAGHYIVGASFPGMNATAEQDSFDIMGMKRTSDEYMEWYMTVGEDKTLSTSIKNMSPIPLTGLNVEIVGMPQECKAEATLAENIAGGSFANLSVSIRAIGVSGGGKYKEFVARITSQEGVVLEIPLYFYAKSATAKLIADPLALDATMTVGARQTVEFRVGNIGSANTGRVTVQIPQLSWMRIVSGSDIADLGNQEYATVQLELSPDESLALNYTYTPTIAVNCENGDGVLIPCRFTPVAGVSGRVRLLVMEKYSLNAGYTMPISNATIQVKNKYTEEVVASGISDIDGIWESGDIPGGTWKVYVTAPYHAAYVDEVVVMAERTLEKTVMMDTEAVSAYWREFNRVDVEDETDIDLVCEYITTVPQPVVVIKDCPDELPQLEEGQSIAFNVVAVNEGWIAAQDVSLDLPELDGYEWKAQQELGLIPAGASVTVPVILTRKRTEPVRRGLLAASSTKVICKLVIRIGYFWDCGWDRKWAAFPKLMKFKGCFYQTEPTEVPQPPLRDPTPIGPEIPRDPKDTKDPDPGRVPPQEVVLGDTCNPCVMGRGYALIDVIKDFFTDLPSNDLTEDDVRNLKEMGLSEDSDLMRILSHFGFGKDADIDFLNGSSDKTTADVVIGELFKEGETINAIMTAVAKDEYWSNPAYAVTLEKIGGTAKMLGTMSDVLDVLSIVTGSIDALLTTNHCAHLNYKPLIDSNGNINEDVASLMERRYEFVWEEEVPIRTRTKLQSTPDAIKDGFEIMNPDIPQSLWSGLLKFETYRIQLTAYRNILLELFPTNTVLSDASFGQVSKLMGVARRHVETAGITSISIAEFEEDASGILSGNTISAFVSNWNEGVAAYGSMAGESPTSGINIYNVLRSYRVMAQTERIARSLGYWSVGQMVAEEKPLLLEAIDKESGSVCASVKLKISQTVRMTREAFEGVLEIGNSSASASTRDILLVPVITDEAGNDVTKLLFAFSQVGSENMSGESILKGGMTLGASQTGTATIRFVPSVDAAPVTPKTYRFGGLLTYINPFTGVTETKEIIPIAMTVNPSPRLTFDYFVQRDVLGDDPFTRDVVEPSIPAEVSLVIRNNGYGDASNVTMKTVAPQILENTKGMMVDFSLANERMVLNGESANIGLNDVHLGTIPAQGQTIAQWWLTCSVQGHFKNFDPSFTHRSSFGETEANMSLVDSVTVHSLIRSVDTDGDDLPDFLVCEHTHYGIPDTIFVGGGNEVPVYSASETVCGVPDETFKMSLTVSPRVAGWNYASCIDGGNGRFEVVKVVRGDGTELPLRNVWLTDRTFEDEGDPVIENRIHLVDNFAGLGVVNYTVHLASVESNPLRVESLGGVEDGSVVAAMPDSVSVVFTKSISPQTFDRTDITIRRQGVKIDDVGAISISPRDESGRTFSIGGLRDVSTADGTYTLTVQAAFIADENGVSGISGKSIMWTVVGGESSAPILSGLRISPDSGCSELDGITYGTDFTLMGDVDGDGLSVQVLARRSESSDMELWSAPLPGRELTVPIHLIGGGSLTLVVVLSDSAGNSSETELPIFIDTMPLTGNLMGIGDDEGVVATHATLTFNAAVVEGDVSLEKFSLTRNGEAVALEGVTLRCLDGEGAVATQWELFGLDALCAEDGVYVLRFDGSAVRKYTSGLMMGGSLAMRWRYENPDREPPTVTAVLFDGETPHEAYTNVFSTVAVAFSEAVNVPELIENGLIEKAARIDLLDAANAVTGSAVVVSTATWNGDSNTLSWTIDPLSVPAGRTRLMLDAGLIADLAGNRLAAGGFASANGMRTYTLSETVLAQVNAQAMPTWYGGELYVGEKTADNRGKIRHYAANGTWTYLQSNSVDVEIPAQGCQGASVAFADMDGDGVVETYVGTATGDALKYPGGETVASLGVSRAMPYAYDIDGDGCDELITGGMDGRIRLISRDMDSGTYSVALISDVNGAPITVPNGRAAPVVADINHDGLVDILSGDTAGNVWAYLGVGAAWCGQPVTVFANDAGLADRSRLGYGDVDGDGIEDLVVGRSDGSVTVMRGTETPSPCVEFTIVPLSVGMAVNADELDWLTDGACEWKGTWSRDASDGLHEARCGAIPNGTNAWLSTVVEGPGTISFKWRSALASRNTKYQFMVDGEVKGMLTGTYGWTEVSISVFGDRVHEIKWRLMTGRSGASAGDCVALDEVVWMPTVPPTLAEALNVNLDWTTDGDVAWHGVARESLTDSRDAWAAVSGLGDEGTSWVQTRVYGSGIMLFDWAISCEEDYDWMELSVDGKVCDYISGAVGWTSSAVEIVGDGWHVVRWEFVKDEMDDPALVGDNIAKLDNVAWVSEDVEPTDPIPAVAVDANAATVNAEVDGVGFADAAVKAVIGGSAAEYNAFKNWAGGVKGATGDTLAGEAAVVANEHAAAAYLLGAERLLENEPTVEFDELAVAEGESAGTTAMTVAVTVKDGENAVKCAAEKVKEMFEATGDLGDWNGAAKLAPSVKTYSTDASGKMTFVVTPGDGTANRAFLRIKR